MREWAAQLCCGGVAGWGGGGVAGWGGLPAFRPWLSATCNLRSPASLAHPPARLTRAPSSTPPARLQLEATAYKTLTGNKLQDQQALLLAPKGQRMQQQQQQPGAGAAAKSASPPVLMLGTSGGGGMAASPLRLGSPRVYGGSAASPMSPLSRSFDRVRAHSCRPAGWLAGWQA